MTIHELIDHYSVLADRLKAQVEFTGKMMQQYGMGFAELQVKQMNELAVVTATIKMLQQPERNPILQSRYDLKPKAFKTTHKDEGAFARVK